MICPLTRTRPAPIQLLASVREPAPDLENTRSRVLSGRLSNEGLLAIVSKNILVAVHMFNWSREDPWVQYSSGAQCQLVTLRSPKEPRRGSSLQELSVIPDGALLIRDGV